MRKKQTVLINHRTLRWIVASISAIGLTYVAAAEDTSPSTLTLATTVPTAPVVAPEESEPLPAPLPAKDVDCLLYTSDAADE